MDKNQQDKKGLNRPLTNNSNNNNNNDYGPDCDVLQQSGTTDPHPLKLQITKVCAFFFCDTILYTY